jgi:uncharacterized membrane protein YagU involved in acid resistance
MSSMNGRPKALETILIGGALAGIGDGLDAVVYYNLASGVAPARLFQHIASGLLGAESFSGGWPTTLLGVVLHFTIAIGAAAVFYGACQAIPALWKYPWVSGPAYGLVVYAVMHYIVVPMSAVAARKAPMSGMELVDQLLSHMFLVGLPIALMARRSART